MKKTEKYYKLEIVKEIQARFNYDTCERQLIEDNINTSDEARQLAKRCIDSLQGKDFFLLSEYKNGKRTMSGKLYNLDD